MKLSTTCLLAAALMIGAQLAQAQDKPAACNCSKYPFEPPACNKTCLDTLLKDPQFDFSKVKGLDASTETSLKILSQARKNANPSYKFDITEKTTKKDLEISASKVLKANDVVIKPSTK